MTVTGLARTRATRALTEGKLLIENINNQQCSMNIMDLQGEFNRRRAASAAR